MEYDYVVEETDEYIIFSTISSRLLNVTARVEDEHKIALPYRVYVKKNKSSDECTFVFYDKEEKEHYDLETIDFIVAENIINDVKKEIYENR